MILSFNTRHPARRRGQRRRRHRHRSRRDRAAADGGGGGRQAPPAPVDHRQLPARDLRQGRRPPLPARQPRARGALWACRPAARWAAPTTSCSARAGRASAASADQKVLDSGRALEAEETLSVGEPRARLPAAPLPAARGRRQRLRGLRHRHRHHRAARSRGHAAGEARVVRPHPPRHRRGPAGAVRPADRGDLERAPRAGGAARADDRRGRPARHAGRRSCRRPSASTSRR